MSIRLCEVLSFCKRSASAAIFLSVQSKFVCNLGQVAFTAICTSFFLKYMMLVHNIEHKIDENVEEGLRNVRVEIDPLAIHIRQLELLADFKTFCTLVECHSDRWSSYHILGRIIM